MTQQETSAFEEFVVHCREHVRQGDHFLIAFVTLERDADDPAEEAGNITISGNRKGKIVSDLRLLAQLATNLADRNEGVQR